MRSQRCAEGVHHEQQVPLAILEDSNRTEEETDHGDLLLGRRFDGRGNIQEGKDTWKEVALANGNTNSKDQRPWPQLCQDGY